MKIAKKILQHNLNNFRHSASLHRELYSQGVNTRSQYFMGLLRCLRERMHIFHWLPSSFIIIGLYFFI